MPRPTLVIGDVHGHLDRLAFLLEQEGIVRETEPGIWERVNHDVEVVQVGDLGHFGEGGSPTGDLFSWEYGREWLDVILWGNHDRAVFDRQSSFRGYQAPGDDTRRAMLAAVDAGQVQWALARHGHLITHAGLHAVFNKQNAPVDKTNPEDVAQWLNGHLGESDSLEACRMAIGKIRGGWMHGGILWRDVSEKLFDAFPQVFGHSADREHAVRYCWRTGNSRKIENVPEDALNVSYCIDVGGKGNRPGDDCLAGIYLPEGRVVRVDLQDA